MGSSLICQPEPRSNFALITAQAEFLPVLQQDKVVTVKPWVNLSDEP